MPLELGISIGLSSVNNHQTRDGQVNQHKWFALVPSRISEGAYQEFISDLQGSDPMSHGETQQTVVNAIMNIFVVMCDLPTECTPVFVIESLPIYEQELENYKIKWGGGPIPWRNTVKIAIRVAQENELIPHGYA
jgi:hypothetical protein